MTSTLRLTPIESRAPIWSGSVERFDTPVTAVEAVEAAGMDTTIEKLPLLALATEHERYDSGKFLLVDRDHDRSFGVVGPDYTFMQNRELASMLDSVLQGKFPVDAVGTTPNGAGIFFLLSAGKTEIAKEAVEQYFLLAEMRQGGFALKQAFTVRRIFCQNALMTALASARTLLAARHDGKFVDRANGSARFMAAAHKIQQENMARFELMAKTQIAKDDFQYLLESTYPMPSRANITVHEDYKIEDPYLLDTIARSTTTYEYLRDRVTEQRRLVTSLFENYGTDNPATQGTVWAAYNVVVEAEDHSNSRGNSEAAHQSALWGSRAAAKVRALTTASTFIDRN
jgi:hypothetical protein